MATAADLGISEQEFQDAMNLEKIYNLVHKSDSRCSKCSNFLCGTHAVGKANCKRIGEDRFTSLEVQKLQRKYGGGSSTPTARRHYSPPVVRSSHSDRHRHSRRAKSTSRRRRAPSPSEDSEPSYSESEDGEEYVPPPKPSRSKSHRGRTASQKGGGRTSSFAAAFDEESNNLSQFQSPQFPAMQTSQYPPGMAGILLQRQQQQLQQQQTDQFGGQAAFGGMFMSSPGSLSQQAPGMFGQQQQQQPLGGTQFPSITNFNSYMLSQQRPPFTNLQQFNSMTPGMNCLFSQQQQPQQNGMAQLSMPGQFNTQQRQVLPGSTSQFSRTTSTNPFATPSTSMNGPGGGLMNTYSSTTGFNTMYQSGQPQNYIDQFAQEKVPQFPMAGFSQPQFSGVAQQQTPSFPLRPNNAYFPGSAPSGFNSVQWPSTSGFNRSYSNPAGMASAQGIPHLAAAQKDWWE